MKPGTSTTQAVARAPQRRWFQFSYSLRTLLMLVTVFAGYFGWREWSLKWISERYEILNARTVEYTCGDCGGIPPGPHAPWPLRFFGERGCEKLVVAFQGADPNKPLTADQEVELDRIRRLFPETKDLRAVVSEEVTPDDPPLHFFRPFR
jgi:hypothetical protein